MSKPRPVRGRRRQGRQGDVPWVDRTRAGQRWQDIQQKRGKRGKR